MRAKIHKSLAWLLMVCMIVLLFPVSSLASSAAKTPKLEETNFKKTTAISLDNAPVPAHDYSRANKLPMTGYFEKSFSVNNETRTAKIYISSEAPIRSYFTVIAVPDGVDTEEFLVKSGWKTLADEKEEGLFVLEPGKDGWGSFKDELSYVNAALGFYSANSYFSIFGEHYLVGYGTGAPALEAWAAANPLKVIGQVYIDSKGLPADYFTQFSTMEFDGKNGNYTEIVFPEGFKKITYDEVVLPTWYINTDKNTISDSVAYWKKANDCVTTGVKDKELGDVYQQKEDSDRWMTSYSGPISKVAVSDKKVSIWNDNNFTREVDKFLTYYTRYENAVAYNNQLVERADYAKLGIEVKNMMVNDEIREYLVYVPETAKKLWGDKAPVLWVWAGNSQTDKVFLDATQWWKPAQEKGFILVIPCEQYSSNSVSVSHKNSNLFYQQLREVIMRDYAVDPTRFYSTGQSAGSSLSQNFAGAMPEYFAAVASTSAAAAPSSSGTFAIDGTAYTASNKMIPNYFIYGGGDGSTLKGDLWDGEKNSLDNWAAYHLGVNGFDLGNGVDNLDVSGWFDRFKTWTWSKKFAEDEIPLLKVTLNLYRSHNCAYEEMPMLLDFLEHYSYEVDASGNVTARYYSPSGFKVAGDKVKID